MSRNEIRLRRNRLSGQRFRNYGAVLQQHEKEMRLKKVLRVFSFLLVILILIALIFYISQIERKVEKKSFNTEKIIQQNT